MDGLPEWVVSLGAMLTGAIAGVFGNWPPLLSALAALMVVDYVTGCVVAFMGKSPNTDSGGWRSHESFIGLLRKTAIIGVVLLATVLDSAIGTESAVFQTAAAGYYVANEGLSILENVVLMGVPVPAVIKKALEALKNKSDGENEESKGDE